MDGTGSSNHYTSLVCVLEWGCVIVCAFVTSPSAYMHPFKVNQCPDEEVGWTSLCCGALIRKTLDLLITISYYQLCVNDPLVWGKWVCVLIGM